MNTVLQLKRVLRHRWQKIFATALLFISIYGGLYAKELKGVMLYSNGQPVRSYYIYNQSDKKTYYTDGQGAFTLTAKEGDVLNFNPNFPSGIYVVGDADSITVIYDLYSGECLINECIHLDFLKENGWDLSQQSGEGVRIMEDNIPAWSGNPSYPLGISYYNLLQEKGGQIAIQQKRVVSRQQARGFEINLKSSVGFNTHMALPKLQSTFAQGKAVNGTLQWLGADQNEPFSWGPAVRNLEYSGTAYDYDSRGSLVPAGSGNGMAAGTYGIRDFFRTGFHTDNSLQVLLPGLLGGYVESGIGQKRNESPMRNSDFEACNFSLALKKMRFENIKAEAGAAYNLSEGHLLNRGANMASVLAALYTTPATFDNKNGLTAKEAVENSSSFTLPSGKLRSYAPHSIENPYGLLQKMPDKEKNTHWLTYAKLRYREDEYKGLKATVDMAYNKYTDDRKNAWFDQSILFNPDQIATRHAKTDAFRLSAYPTYRFENQDKLMLYAEYVMDYQKQQMTMSTNAPFSDSRLFHEVKYGARLSWDADLNGIVDISTRNYFSNTIDKQGRFLPYAGLMLDLSEYVREFSDYLRINANAGMSLNEVPLIYDNYAILSTGIRSSQFFKFRELQYLGATGRDLKPEILKEYQAGLSMGLLRNRLDIGLEYYNTTTSDYIAPVSSPADGFVLDNLAKINNSSINASVKYNSYTGSGLHYNVELHFSKPMSKVVRLNHNESYVPVAGFSNAFTALTEGEPIGVIYGTRWKRDDYGYRVIGDNGFPLVDTRPAKIGDPTPDFISSLYSSISWKELSFSFTLEYHHKGDRWNGTQAYLDYLGASQNSAEQRIIRNYVFEGVNTSGQINTTPVDFYNPASDVNRWTQYGPDGVGEDYIQDATFLRLSSAALFYDLKKIRSKLLKNVSVGVTANNVFVLTKYKGSDPTTSLFNYNTTKGLDMFNMPGVRSYLLTLRMKVNK